MTPDETDRDVLKSLPQTRPQRRSTKRDAAAKKPAAAKSKPKAKAKAKPASRAKAAGARRRSMPAAGFSPPRATEDQAPPSGTELIGTAIQAAGELAQIGLAVGGHALRSALDRLPKP
jgi:hypothetical protein